MDKLILVVVSIFVLIAAIEITKFFLGRTKKGTAGGRRFPGYHTKPIFFNNSEMAFFFELQKKLPQGFYVFPKTRLADFIEPNNTWGRYKGAGRIMPKHVDFLICDAHFKPVYAIEVNGFSHQAPERQASDIQKKEIFADAGLPLVFVNVGTDFSAAISDIVHQISQTVTAQTAQNHKN